MEEIDMDNIVGSRTRGKNIDFAEAAKNMEEDEEDEEDDEDFQDDDAMVGVTSASEHSVLVRQDSTARSVASRSRETLYALNRVLRRA